MIKRKILKIFLILIIILCSIITIKSIDSKYNNKSNTNSLDDILKNNENNVIIKNIKDTIYAKDMDIKNIWISKKIRVMEKDLYTKQIH